MSGKVRPCLCCEGKSEQEVQVFSSWIGFHLKKLILFFVV